MLIKVIKKIGSLSLRCVVVEIPKREKIGGGDSHLFDKFWGGVGNSPSNRNPPPIGEGKLFPEILH